MKIVKIVLGVVLALILIFVVVGLFLPNTYNFSREVVIQAPPERIHQYVGDLKEWEVWSPWKDGDPTIVTTVGSQTAGVGANQSWDGDSGNGKLVFTSTDPQKGITFDLEFRDGSEKSQASILYTPQGDATVVTWTMKGDVPVPVIGGYFAQFLLPSMVAPMFELGLGKLKNTVETGSPTPAS